jgi:DNA polymerase-3 subunit delta'
LNGSDSVAGEAVPPRPDLAGRLLTTALLSGQIGQAYLFHGPRGVGKMAAARAFAADLLCGAPRDGRSCGACASCRAAAGARHPDLVIASPDGMTLKIDQIRELLRRVTLRPVAGERRVFLLEDADRLTLEAANALLKSLEEPPPGTTFILVTTNRDALPATIISRCAQIPFRPLGIEAVSSLLREEEGLSPSEALFLARLSGGCPGRAREYARDPETAAVRSRAAALVDAMDELTLDRALVVADELERLYGRNRQAMEALLDMSALEAAERLRGSVVRTGQAGTWLRRVATIEESAAGLRRNVNVRLCLDFLLMSLAQ